MGERLKKLFTEYGPIALGIYLTTFALSMIGFSAAINFGWQVEGGAAQAGTVGLAYVATQAIKPLRIGLTLGLTPVVAAALGRAPAPGEGDDLQPTTVAVGEEDAPAPADEGAAV